MSNLKPKIAKSVRLFYPKTLTHVFNLAKQVESMIYNLPHKPFETYKNAPVAQSLPTQTPAPKQTLNSSYNPLPPLLPTPKIPPNYYTSPFRQPYYGSNLSSPKTNTNRPEFSRNAKMPIREERDERRKRGLYMRCGMKYIATHNCVKF